MNVATADERMAVENSDTSRRGMKFPGPGLGSNGLPSRCDGQGAPLTAMGAAQVLGWRRSQSTSADGCTSNIGVPYRSLLQRFASLLKVTAQQVRLRRRDLLISDQRPHRIVRCG